MHNGRSLPRTHQRGRIEEDIMSWCYRCECEHCANWDECLRENQQKCADNRCMNVNNGEEVKCNNFTLSDLEQ